MCPIENTVEYMNSKAFIFIFAVYGKVRVVRQCGYLTDNNSEQACRRQSGNGELFVTYCSCDTDLCNSSPAHVPQGFILGVSLLFVVLRIDYSFW